MTDDIMERLAKQEATAARAIKAKRIRDSYPMADPMHVEADKSACEHLRDTKMICARWAFIGLVACFWIAVANNWPWISAAVRGWL